jgi:hypothetical protein
MKRTVMAVIVTTVALVLGAPVSWGAAHADLSLRPARHSPQAPGHIRFKVFQVGSREFTTITFENGGNIKAIPPVAGATFSPNALTLIDSDAGGSGNIAHERSPDTVAFWLEGTSITVSFDSPVAEVFTFYASTESVRVTGFGADGSELFSVKRPPNLIDPCTGDPSGDFCRFSRIGFDLGENAVVKVEISGTANFAVIDDLTFSRIVA